MPGSRFHPYLSTQAEARLVSMATSDTYTENSFRTPSIPNSSVCPHPDPPQHSLSTPYTIIEGTRWQPGVGWSTCQYSPVEQNLLAMEHQRLALHQQHWMEAPNKQQMEALMQQQRMEAPNHKQMEALMQQQRMEAPNHKQMEALMQQQWMEAPNHKQMEAPKQPVEAFRHQQQMRTVKQKQQLMEALQQQRWMETLNLTYMADSPEYTRYMEDSSQQYIRYMDKLRLISEASVPSVATGPVLPTLSVPVPRQTPMQDQPLNLSLKDRFKIQLEVIDLYVKKDILKELDEKFAFQFAVMPET